MTRNVEAIYHVTPLQHGMLYHSLRDRTSGIYVEQFSCVIEGPLRCKTFEAAWCTVVQRHDVLRTLFIRLHDREPFQVVRKEAPLSFVHLDWQDISAEEQDKRFSALLSDDRRQGFDLSRAPLMRWHLIAMGPDRHRLLWTYHHAILDGWSMPVILDEVVQVYAATVSGRPLDLPRPAPYRTYVSWLRAQDSTKAMAYWQDALKGFQSPLTFAPSMKPGQFAAATGQRQLATIRSEVQAAWREQAVPICRANKITLNTLCQGAWSLLLSLYCDTDDVVYGTVISGRPADLSGIESMVGLFINTLPLRVQIESEAVLVEWLRRLQAVNMDNERYGYSALAELQKVVGLPPQQNLFDTLYVFENYPGQAQLNRVLAAHGLAIRDIHAVEETNYPLALIVIPHEGLTLQLTYDIARFSEAAVECLMEDYRHLLQQMLNLTAIRLSDLRPPHVKPKVQADSVTTPPGLEPTPRTLLSLLAQHAKVHPDEPAYTDGVRSISFRQLTAALMKCCREWREQGYQAGDRVWLDFDDELVSLVTLVSGLACGIECVVLDPDTRPWVIEQTGGGWRGLSELTGCVCDHGRMGILPNISRKRFPMMDGFSASTDATEIVLTQGRSGAVLLGHGDLENGWEVLKYDEPALLAMVDWFVETYPVVEGRCVPVAGSPLRAANLWTTLLALGSGLTVRHLRSCADADFAVGLQEAGVHCHSVRLSTSQTRLLSLQAPRSRSAAIRTDYLIVDAMAATPRVLEKTRSFCNRAKIVKELRFPESSMPHTWLSRDGEPSNTHEFLSRLGNPVNGSKLFLLDRHLRLTGTHAFGRVGVTGQSVPSAQFGHSRRTLLPAPLPHQNGSLLLMDIKAWHSGTHVYAGIPCASHGGSLPDPRLIDIENRLKGLPAMEDAAIIQRVTEDGEWENAIFYVCATDAAARLEQAIVAVFTQYQLSAGSLVRLEQLPRDDKRVNRRALLHGDVVLAKQDAYDAPRDEVEGKLQSMWQELLKRERIGIRDNYFELGGQSLLATVLLYQIEEAFQQRIDLDLFLEQPTIEGLANLVKGSGPTQAQPRDLTQEVQLDDNILPPTAFDPQAFEAEAIFLTGATGFLGVHLLADLLEQTQADTYCLLKVPDARTGIQQLVATLSRFDLWKETYRPRLHAVPGDLEKPLFGLDEAQFSALAATVDAVYHNAAGGNFVYPYGALKRVNVLAVKDILRLACTHKTKPVHYVSTADVLNRTHVAEEMLSVPLHPFLAGGYEQSKWVAEQIICVASDRGLPVTVYRPTRIGGHSQTGVSNPDDLFCRMVRGIVELGTAPHDAGMDNIVPVDLVSRILVESSLDPRVYGRAIHVANPVPHRIDRVVDYIEAAGFPVRRVDLEQWLQELSAHVKDHSDHPLAMVVPVLERLKSARDAAPVPPQPIALLNIQALLGERVLESIKGIDELLPVYFSHLYSVGYLPAPEDSSRRSRQSCP